MGIRRRRRKRSPRNLVTSPLNYTSASSCHHVNFCQLVPTSACICHHLPTFCSNFLQFRQVKLTFPDFWEQSEISDSCHCITMQSDNFAPFQSSSDHFTPSPGCFPRCFDQHRLLRDHSVHYFRPFPEHRHIPQGTGLALHFHHPLSSIPAHLHAQKRIRKRQQKS